MRSDRGHRENKKDSPTSHVTDASNEELCMNVNGTRADEEQLKIMMNYARTTVNDDDLSMNYDEL